MTLPHPYTGNETKAEQPLDQDLMDLKVRENIESLSSQIDAIGGGGAGGAVDTGNIGEILIGGETNEPRYWKRRFHPLQHMLNSDSENPSGFDPEGKSLKNELLSFIQSNDTGIGLGNGPDFYLGQNIFINKNSKVSFKIKKGINFFSVSFWEGSTRSDSITITIDGVAPSLLGLSDENGNAAPDTISSNSATTFNQSTKFFYGLDNEEHLITIENTDSGSNTAYLNFVEVGYRSENPTIDESIHINTGKATVRGSQVTFADSDFSFGKTELNGHTGAIVCDNTGALSVVDGESPAFTQCRAEETVVFSSAVTQLKVKNNFYFPDNGICLLSTPYGNHHMFSYTGKTDALIQAHTLNNLIWQSQPTEDFTPLSGFTGGTGEAKGDLAISYWGTSPILISSSNNKIDFSITKNGVTTTHVATIANGRYAADLVHLEKAWKSSMQTAHALNGSYNLNYNKKKHIWDTSISSDEVTEIKFLFSTGVNVANSIHSTIGFDGTDLVGETSYFATNEKEHLCCRVLERDAVYMHSEDPRIKYSQVQQATGSLSKADLEDRLNLGTVRFLDGAGLFQIFVDEDCCGLQIDFLTNNDSGQATIQIDDGQCIYLTRTYRSENNGLGVRGRLISGFVSFPRGSRKITVRAESSTVFNNSANKRIFFAGCRQYFTKPAYEKLTLSQAIVKTFDISPISLYATIYGHNGGSLYSSTGTDNINTITESGSWSGGNEAGSFNQGYRINSTAGGYVDINFTLVGDGGGVALKMFGDPNGANLLPMFLSQSAINESTDRVQNNHIKWADYYDQDRVQILGLKSGTYNVRFKTEGGQFRYLGVVIYDTVAPEENKNTVSDVTGIGQSVTYPINVIREAIQQDSDERVPSWLSRSGYKEGRKSLVNYSLNSPSFTNYDDSSNALTAADFYYSNNVEDNVNGATMSLSAFCKSVSVLDVCRTFLSTVMQPFVDGTQTLNNYSQRVQVKGGSSPSSVRLSASRLSQKIFNLSCSFNAGLIYNISDTRGIKNNQVVILSDGVNEERAVIDSFVVGISFTIKKALSTVVAANVISVDFKGFHTYKILAGDATEFRVSCFEYEPLKISPSKSLQRTNTKFKYEKVSITHRGIPSGGDVFYPVHSDGIVGNWTTSTIEVIGANGGAYRLDQDLKNISGSDLDLKISSERLVPILDESERF